MNKKLCRGEYREETELKKKTYVHHFRVTTDCPFLSEGGLENDLIHGSIGYKFAVKELEVL